MTAVAGPAVAGAERAARSAARVRAQRRRSLVRGVRTGLQALLIALWCLLPVYWMVVTSLKPLDEVYGTALVPRRITFGNYAEAFAPVNQLLPGLIHSVAIAALVTGVTLLIGLPGAYALARYRVPGRALIVGAVLAASMLPGVTLLTPLFAFFSTIGFSSTFLALIVPYIALAMPLGAYTLTVFLRDVPWELEDAALVDGCSRPQAFRRIVLPLLAPAVVTVALLTFIATWNEYLVASALSVQETITVTVVIANFSAQLTGAAPTMAAGVIAAGPLVLLVLVFQRRITAGLTAGSIKG